MTNKHMQKINIQERRAKSLQLRKAGVTYRDIAQETGVSLRTAHTDVTRALEAITRPHAEELLSLELERLDDLWREMYPKVVNKNPDVKAVNALINIHEKRVKLLHLDEINHDPSTDLKNTLTALYQAGANLYREEEE